MSNFSIKEYVDKYYNEYKQPNNRFLSWDHCYHFLQNENNKDEDLLSLHLAFYLASWGMYRGSSFLLQQDYKIHEPIIRVIKKEFTKLNSIDFFSSSFDSNQYINLILNMKAQIENCYPKNYKLFGEEKPVLPSDILITKILLGTSGCIPAFDRFFIDGFKSNYNKEFSGQITIKNINLILDFIKESKTELLDIQNRLLHDKEYKDKNIYKIKYPLMKFVDVCFWQLGYDKTQKKEE